MKFVKDPVFWGLHAKPGPILTKVLGILPIVLLICGYLAMSHYRHIDNPNDKLMPTVTQMYDSMKTIATVPDKRSGEIFLWSDTFASLRRLFLGVAIASVFGYFAGILLGIYPGLRALFTPLNKILSNVNPLALLVIILVVLGVGETSKIFLIVFGLGIPLMRSIQQSVEKIPKELIVKSLTLGASEFEVIARVAAPQMLPRMIELIRINLGLVWIFVIAAEAVAATEGLGYRIYLQQRYMNMSLIIPYVFYISFLAFIIDTALKQMTNKLFKWY